jgi:hypothetical protein
LQWSGRCHRHQTGSCREARAPIQLRYVGECLEAEELTRGGMELTADNFDDAGKHGDYQAAIEFGLVDHGKE